MAGDMMIAHMKGLAPRVGAELAKREFKYFIRMAWPHLEPGVEFVDGWAIDALADHIVALFRGEIRNLIINIPPRTLKSTISGVLFPAWSWLSSPSFTMITSSYEHGLAVRDALKSRRLMDTPWYTRCNRHDGTDTLPEPVFRMRDNSVRALARLKDTESFYENDKGGYRIAVSVGGSVTGKGADLLAVDDPQNPQQAFSEAERLQTVMWWDHTMSTRANNPKTVRKLIVMQRLHTFDLTGHELSKELGAVHLKLPMEFDTRKRCVTVLGKNSWTDPRTQDGETLWPARFGEKEINELKARLGPFGYAGQQQQEPVPEGGGIIDVSKFQRWTALPVMDLYMMSVDCAFTDHENSSYVVAQVWGKQGAHGYLIEQVRDHMDIVKTIDTIKRLHRDFRRNRMPISLTGVENKANGPAVISMLIKEIPGIEPLEPRRMGGSKEARAHAIAPLISAGNVYIPSDAPWLTEFFLELRNFPKYISDDQVDAMSQALWRLFLSRIDPEKARRKRRFLLWSGGDPTMKK